MTPLTPLEESPSLDKLAYERIKDAILSFQFLPKQALVEGELAVQLGISKTPVRDALMRLEKEGLVSRVSYKGTFVADINNQDMQNIFMIRIVLEGLATRLAAPRMTDDDFSRMEKLILQHEDALRNRHVAKASDINAEFHDAIISRCGNPRLVQMLNNLDDHLKRYRLLSISQGARADKSIPEHRAILQALRARDADQAEQAMCEHLQSAMRDLYDQNFEELEASFRNRGR